MILHKPYLDCQIWGMQLQCSLKLHGTAGVATSPHSYFVLSGFPSALQVFSLKIKNSKFKIYQ